MWEHILKPGEAEFFDTLEEAQKTFFNVPEQHQHEYNIYAHPAKDQHSLKRSRHVV